MEKYPWFRFYPENIPFEIDPDAYKSLLEFFDDSFNKFSNLISFESFGNPLKFKDLDRFSLRFASFFQNQLGLVKGDKIAIQMPNTLQYPIVLTGALRAGLIVVNTNPLYTSREMEYQFRDSGVKAIVILANFAKNLERILNNTRIEHVIITELGDVLRGMKGHVVNFVVKRIKKMVPKYNIPGAIPFKSILRKADQKAYNRPEITGDDLAFLQYTGGTTGISKGAMLSHRNIIANLEQVAAWIRNEIVEREETMITALPLYHIFALTINYLVMIKIGARNILITNPRDMKAFIKDLKRYKFSLFTGVNTLFNALLHQEEFRKLDFSNFKLSVGGGMAVQNAVAKEWQKLTGIPLAEGYGLSETSPVVSVNPIDGTERIGTIGLPVPSTEVKILDDDGNELPVGETGEICVKGPQVMSGYWQMPEETKLVFHGEWFRTGDIGAMDEDGFFRIVDRKKEMINVSGFNVYPNEIEDVVRSHPKVMEAGAIGVPDERSTEAVKIFVVKKDESLTEEELIQHCKENLTAYKRPKYIEFRNELPKSPIGKILRRMLKEDMEKEIEEKGN